MGVMSGLQDKDCDAEVVNPQHLDQALWMVSRYGVKQELSYRQMKQQLKMERERVQKEVEERMKVLKDQKRSFPSASPIGISPT